MINDQFVNIYRVYDITEYWCDTTGCYIRNDVIVIQNVIENMIQQESKEYKLKQAGAELCQAQ